MAGSLTSQPIILRSKTAMWEKKQDHVGSGHWALIGLLAMQHLAFNRLITGKCLYHCNHVL